ncbi:MAG: hypothetical protein GEU94_06445 [Micromonosporaceae bacterium]|nr:hypothetical protein [Micromonosporaceae bacterium]
MTERPPLAEAFPRRPRPHRPTEEELDAAQRMYDAHSPSLVTHACVAAGCDEQWPCQQYRNARHALVLGGRIQPTPLRPSL